jgi:hypothetical protein
MIIFRLEKWLGVKPLFRCRICGVKRKREEVMVVWDCVRGNRPLEDSRGDQGAWWVCFGCADAVRKALENEERAKSHGTLPITRVKGDSIL